jgi:8-oxo-dGTP diphosphatase
LTGGAKPEVLAAGAVPLRRRADGVEVAVIHRPRYEDWSLPKGKLNEGESFEDAALREVEEETGLRGELGAELSSHTYTDRKGRSKLVRWWLMLRPEGEFRVNHEADRLRWISPEQAEEMLDYEHDRALVREAIAQAG